MNNIEQIKNDYGLLYEIENKLRKFIDLHMTRHYGMNWHRTAPRWGRYLHGPYDNIYFHELEGYFHHYHFNVSQSLIKSLRKLYPIRNRIAHCHPLFDYQIQTLNDAYKRIEEEIELSLEPELTK